MADERRASKLAAMIDKDGITALLRSVALLQQEALAGAEQLSETASGAGADY